MTDGFTLDASELRALAADLGKIPAKASGDVEKVLKKGAVNIKREMRAAFEGSPYFRAAARSVSFDRVGFASSFGFEVGPTLGGAGSLAGIAVEGGANGGGGTVNIDPLLPKEAAAVERFIGGILDGLL